MKRWNKVLVTAALMSGAFAAGVYAEDVLQRVDAYLRPDFRVMLNGEQVLLSSPPLIYNDNSYLPLKELGSLLGANILWRGDSKTIFINSRIYPEQQTPEEDGEYEEIELKTPSFIKVSYLGAEYPLLMTYDKKTNGSAVYYRLSDVRRMGIDTDGLNKVKEKYTQYLFVNEQELRSRWNTPPVRVNVKDRYYVGGEINPKKIEKIQEHIQMLLNYKVNDLTFTTRPIMIDKISDNEYDFLFQERVYTTKAGTVESYYLARLKTKQDDITGLYTVELFDKKNLQTEWQKRLEEKEKEKGREAADS